MANIRYVVMAFASSGLAFLMTICSNLFGNLYYNSLIINLNPLNSLNGITSVR